MQTQTAIEQTACQITQQLNRVVVGKEEAVFWVFAAILAGGHILLEDIPGVGKTTLAAALSKTLGLQLGRLQFTPDVMPSDVVGYCVPEEGKMVYRPGAVMCNLFLADELNRAASRTQSALLEAMEEGQVTVDGVCYKLPRPFIVIATQNPLGAAGTQPLPDSQLERFALRLALGYPSKAAEGEMLLQQEQAQLQPVISAQELLKLQQEVEHTYISPAVAAYMVALVAATRKALGIYRGASPRTTLSVAAVSKAVAQLSGRDYVIPEDVRKAFLHCAPHRILARGKEEACLRWILARVRPPKLC